jgi:two-component system phosphate regulon sensor histidine kinase PhoR
LGKRPATRLGLIAASAAAPAACVLVVAGARGDVGWIWIALAIAVGGAIAGVLIASAVRTEMRRAERITALAASLAAARRPAHLVPDEGNILDRAERVILDAADASVAQTARLIEQRDEFEAILRSMTEAVVVTGPRGEVILLNGAARRVFSLAPEAALAGRPFIELCRDPRLNDFVARATAQAPDQITSAEIALQTPALLHLSASAAPVRTAHGAATVYVFHDITQLKSYETVRADFISNLTHELRTPLSALCGYAETLMLGVDDPETVRRFLSIIERQARRLARLLDDLVSLSDLERGLTPLKIVQIDVARMVEESVELMSEVASKRGIELKARCDDGLPSVGGDRDRIQQVMLNLLDNAIKYTPTGGHVTASAHAAAGSEAGAGAAREGVALGVADSGEGIPAADIPRLTERFYRVDRARSRELGGTGLGLAIIKHIVQLHHGTLKIESRLREGTTVTVWFPTAQS